MGSFKLEFQAVGGHGCDRTAKEGDLVVGCGRDGCPDCECKRVAEALRAKFSYVERATLTHWPGTPSAVVDEFDATGGVLRKHNDFFNSNPQTHFDFGQALALLKTGHRLCREGWNGKGMFIELQRPDAGSKMSLPYLFMRTVQGDLVPWLASQTDLLAEDWRLV